MPTLPPVPPPPAIEHFISLGDRLDAAASRVQVPGEPTRTVSASLPYVPSHMHAVFGTNVGDEPVLELTFAYLEQTDETKLPVFAQEVSEGRHAVEMEVGAQTGRVYRLAAKGLDLSDNSVRIVTDGIRACFKDYVRVRGAPLRQQAILHSVLMLVTRLLPGLTGRIRSEVGNTSKPPA